MSTEISVVDFFCNYILYLTYLPINILKQSKRHIYAINCGLTKFPRVESICDISD